MSDIDWAVVEAVFEEAQALPPPGRGAFLDTRCAGQPTIRAEVESLLEAHEAATGFLVAPPAPFLPEVAAGTDLPGVGSLVGAYRLTREIGAGGMGTVYLGERADGSFEHTVAVKIARAPLSDRVATRRFHVERQTLASLRHPNIVSLVDAGTAADGHAYLVMEYVEGRPITTWLRERQASLEDRLRMFRQVCSAVHAAHQLGIVHRDIKPANILVTATGAPKVLDFGIAKLLSAEASVEATATGLWQAPLTPDYASPEQLRGVQVTTATDVYALGVLLFEILAGARPYDVAGKPLDDMLREVLGTTARRASVAARATGDPRPYDAGRLRGDLDAIVQKAMHVEPAERYASAEELSDDVARFLGGKPVNAREPSLGYVLRKLAGQYRLAVTLAAVGIVGILVALAIALWQRQVAIRERAAAEARFEDVRSLANLLIFKVHDGIVPLAGSTPLRKVVVEEALAYLDAMADQRADESLQLDVARGYVKMGRALGDPQQPNLGDYAGARVRLQRATELLEPLRRSPTLWREAGTESVQAWRSLAMVQQALKDRPASLTSARRALGVAEELSARVPVDEAITRIVASAHFNLALALARGDEAMQHWTQAGDKFEALLRAKPDDRERMRNVALVDKYVGALLLDAGRVDDGVARYRRALELDERRLAMRPDDRQAQLDVAIDVANLGAGLVKAGQRQEALAYYDRSVSLREAIVAADPKDRMARNTLARVLSNAADAHERSGSRTAAAEYAARFRSLGKADRELAADTYYLRNSFRVTVVEAQLADSAGRRADACRLFDEAVRVGETQRPPEGWGSVEENLLRHVRAKRARCEAK